MRLEGNLTRSTALGANGVIHLTRAAFAAVGLAVCKASLASLGLVGEALFCEKLLLAGSKGEFLSAILADQYFVAVHCLPSFFSVAH